VLATLTMDLAMVAAASCGRGTFTSDRIGPDVIGRWARGPVARRWRHRDIRSERAERGELALGILTHYATGIILTRLSWKSSAAETGMPASSAPRATASQRLFLPLLILYPSLGYGWFGLRSGEAARICRIMLLGHTAFGMGIGLWAPYFTGARRGR